MVACGEKCIPRINCGADSQLGVPSFPELHDGGGVARPVHVVGRREHGHQLPEKKEVENNVNAGSRVRVSMYSTVVLAEEGGILFERETKKFEDTSEHPLPLPCGCCCLRHTATPQQGPYDVALPALDKVSSTLLNVIEKPTYYFRLWALTVPPSFFDFLSPALAICDRAD